MSGEYGAIYHRTMTEPTEIEVLVHDGDEEECVFSSHPGDQMDGVCVHGLRLRPIFVPR